MSASIPNLGEMALQLEYRLVEAVSPARWARISAPRSRKR